MKRKSKKLSSEKWIIEEVDKKIKEQIKPLILEKLYKKNEYTVFDAIRDNKGKGIKAKDLIKILKKTV